MDGRAESFCERVKHKCLFHFWDVTTRVIGLLSSLPNVPYAMGFSYNGSPVSAAGFSSLSTGQQIGSVFNAASTIAVSGAFGAYFIKMARKELTADIKLWREKRNRKRIATVWGMSLLSAITGSSIAGASFEGPLKWGASATGFICIGTFSYIGMKGLIKRFFDEDAKFFSELICYLQRIHPDQKDRMNVFLNGKELTPDTVYHFFRYLFDEAMASRVFVRDPHSRRVMLESAIFVRTCHPKKVVDGTLASLMALNCSIFYIQNGFNGINSFTAGALTDLSNPAKILMGIPPGISQTLFFLFGLKIFQTPLIEHRDKIFQDPISFLKGCLFVAACCGNATWLFGLAQAVAKSENLFSFVLDSEFGKSVFPWITYMVAFFMATDGLFSSVFPAKHQDPKVNDVVLAMQSGTISPESLRNLKLHTFFRANRVKRNEPPRIELKVSTL